MARQGGEAEVTAPAWAAHVRTPGAGSLIGVEHEYRVIGPDGSQADFRQLIHGLAWDGQQLDPGDRNAYRLRSGLAVTADGMEAEAASPPVATEGRFEEALLAWAAAGRRAIAAALGPRFSLEGYATHLSVSAACPAAFAERYARTFGPVFARLAQRPGSLGLYVRPRPGRLELCGEYLEGEALARAALFAVGSVRAAAEGAFPPEVRAALLPCEERFGYRLHRTLAFGFDAYTLGPEERLPLAGEGTITVASLVSAAVGLAGAHLAMPRRARDELLRAALAGPLRDLQRRPGHRPRSLSPGVFGDCLAAVQRPRFVVEPLLATWGHTVFRATREPGSAAVCVESSALPGFLRLLRSGALDAQIERALDQGGSLPALGAPGQPFAPGFYSSVADPLALVPAEVPVAGPGKAGARRAKDRPVRIGKVATAVPVPATREPPPGPPAAPAPRPRAVPRTWWAAGAGALLAAALLGASLALLTGGDDNAPETSATPLPGTTVAAAGATAAASAAVATTPTALPATATVPARESPTTAGATATESPPATATPTGLPASTATAGAEVTPAATPTRFTEPTPTPGPSATPTPAATPTATPTPTPTPTPPTVIDVLPPGGETPPPPPPPPGTPCPPGVVC